ncbi:hypothetical protein RKD29_006609 [Streptomyces tendae]
MGDHEEGGVGGGGEVVECLVGGGVEGEGDGVAVVGGCGGSWVVGGELELFGEVVEGGFPVGELFVEEAGGVVLGAEEFVLPQGVVDVLDGEGGPGGWVSLVAGGVGGGEVVGQGAG